MEGRASCSLDKGSITESSPQTLEEDFEFYQIGKALQNNVNTSFLYGRETYTEI
jgi:hypothetical protein